MNTARAAEISARVERAGAVTHALWPRLLAYLRELISIPTDNPPGDCRKAADRVQRELTDLGFDVERYEVDRSDGPPLPSVLGWLGPRTKRPELLLNAHVDASPPTPEWTVEPYEAISRGGRIYGRGATLAKGDVACYAYALAAARHVLGPEPGATAVLAITSDEGSGGERGPRYLLEELRLRPARAITAGFTHRVGIAHNGAIQARLTV